MTPFQEKRLFYEGILNPREFAQNYVLRCYEPSEAMRPFVEHYFISRRRAQFDPAYVGYDVLSQPVVSLFIQPGEAFFQGPTSGRRRLRAKDSPIYVGAQFKPGGFYPFWRKKIAELAEKTIPADSVIPKARTVFGRSFLLQDDMAILNRIDEALRAEQPKRLPGISLVNHVIQYIESNSAAASVASVASHFAISARTLQHLFQTIVGVGVKWTIMRARFLEITKYARSQAKPDWVTIAMKAGYSDQSHFINDFKKIVGVSPRQYIRMLTGDTQRAG